MNESDTGSGFSRRPLRVGVLLAAALALAACGEKYPVNVETNFLNACEMRGSVSACSCALDWMEEHVSFAQYQVEEAQVLQGGATSSDIGDAIRACA